MPFSPISSRKRKVRRRTKEKPFKSSRNLKKRRRITERIKVKKRRRAMRNHPIPNPNRKMQKQGKPPFSLPFLHLYPTQIHLQLLRSCNRLNKERIKKTHEKCRLSFLLPTNQTKTNTQKENIQLTERWRSELRTSWAEKWPSGTLPSERDEQPPAPGCTPTSWSSAQFRRS